MRPATSTALLTALFGTLSVSPDVAAQTYATGSGNWSNAATWTNGVPGPADNANIGTGAPGANVATVTMTQASFANIVSLGGGDPSFSGTLDLGGFTLNATGLFFNTAIFATPGTATLLRTGGGTLLIGNSGISVNASTLSLVAADVSSALSVGFNATVTTVATGNVTTNVAVGSQAATPSSILNLGADLSLSNQLSVDNGTLNANGHALSAAGSVFLGVNNGPFILNDRGAITANTLAVSSAHTPSLTSFSLTAADHVTTFSLVGVGTALPAGAAVQALNLFTSGSGASAVPSTATTSAPGNVTAVVFIDPGSMLTLGADLNLSNQLSVNGTLNANGHAVSANDFRVGNSGGPAALQNAGVVTAGSYNQGNGSQVQLRQPGSTIQNFLSLTGNSTLTLGDAAGQTTGLTLSFTNESLLSIDSGSDLMIEVNGLASGWVLRWADPDSVTNHIADLQTLIGQGRITFADLNGGGFSLTSDASYTYINPTAVPEPSTMLLSSAAAAGLLTWRRRQVRKAACG
jgi:hypothetical protein